MEILYLFTFNKRAIWYFWKGFDDVKKCKTTYSSNWWYSTVWSPCNYLKFQCFCNVSWNIKLASDCLGLMKYAKGIQCFIETAKIKYRFISIFLQSMNTHFCIPSPFLKLLSRSLMYTILYGNVAANSPSSKQDQALPKPSFSLK